MMAELSTPSKRMAFCWLARPLKRMLSKLPPPVVTAPGGQQVELGNLAAVEWQAGHFALVDVGADAGRTGVDDNEFSAGDGNGLLHLGGGEGQLERALLADGEGDGGVLRGGHAGGSGGDGVRGRSEVGGDEGALVLATTSRMAPVFSFLILMTAPGMTAPEASVTVPTRRAESPWAKRRVADRATRNSDFIALGLATDCYR